MQNDCFHDSIAGWRKVPVSELACVNPRYPVNKGQEYPFIEMASVGENFGGIQRIEVRNMEGSGLSRFKVNDTLFAKITPCPENGKIAFVSALPAELGLGSTEFVVLSPRSGCLPRFLFHLVCSHEVRGRAAARMEGSTGRQRVPDDVFEKRLLVPEPSHDEQAAIARFLDALDIALERARTAVARARELKRALTQDVFAKGTRSEPQRKTVIGFVPRSWRVVTVESVVTTFQYRLSVPMQQKGETPILRMGNIQAGDVVFNEVKYVTLPERIIAPYVLKTGDVLFNRTNSQEWVGKVGIY